MMQGSRKPPMVEDRSLRRRRRVTGRGGGEGHEEGVELDEKGWG
jgi:hypothetical protein